MKMPYVKRSRAWWIGFLVLSGVLILVRVLPFADGQLGSLSATDLLGTGAVVAATFAVLFIAYEIIAKAMGLSRRDAATTTAIRQVMPNALIVYAAQTPMSKQVLGALRADTLPEWALAIAVDDSGLSIWQSSSDDAVVQLIHQEWRTITQMGLVMEQLRTGTTPTLELDFTVSNGQSVEIRLIVRRGAGSAIGLGHGARLESIADSLDVWRINAGR
ncbi:MULTISPECIES: hypothetical protein [unclassified Cryobacterium]|uniref:hypothetical protein n=1 Tax=unclassified Cryobacterium TaxID=2649013 RepID=UPI002AB4AD2E|nr:MULTISPECIES: hypothetical protein [unclassified Cryobacterium]MDY7530054.1 hypothetical protein [Cryobacterium sp. 10C2]MDY7555299.1 hypothetical protein [Cryobacterium sp. 10C3]MEB0290609.1 hypothetical protein [Cryobacterium sp. 10C2]